MDILVIDGVALPTPNEYKVQLNDLDSSDTGRTEDGVMMCRMPSAWATARGTVCPVGRPCSSTISKISAIIGRFLSFANFP